MKLCPNPRCPYRVRRGYPAEFLDHADECNDCTMPLVDEKAFGSAEARRAVAEWNAERATAEVAAPPSPEDARRVDVITGVALIALSVVGVAASYWVAVARGGGAYFIAIAPFVYGFVRLARGLGPPKTAKRAARDPYREPPV